MRIAALRAFFVWQGQPELTAGLRMRRAESIAREPFTLDELRALVHAAKRGREQAILLTLIDTGVRRAELLGMNIDDVNWETGTIRIRGKGQHLRAVALGRRSFATLRVYRNGYQTGSLWKLSKSGLKRMLDGVGERAGVGACFPHRFRVSVICGLIEADVDPLVVSTLAGHSLEMVKHYQRAIESRRALVVQRRLGLGDRL